MGGREHCYFFLDPVAAVDVLTASKNDEKLVETRTVHFARLKSSSRSERISKLDRDYSNWLIVSIVSPLK